MTYLAMIIFKSLVCIENLYAATETKYQSGLNAFFVIDRFIEFDMGSPWLHCGSRFIEFEINNFIFF